MNILPSTILIVAVLAFLAWALRSISREAEEVHDKLREFRALAENACDRRELLELRHELFLFARERCWHRHYGSHAREVLNYIDGRLSTFPTAL